MTKRNQKKDVLLFDKAIGFDIIEITEYKDKDGNIKRIEKKTHRPPELASIISYLNKHAPDRWRKENEKDF